MLWIVFYLSVIYLIFTHEPNIIANRLMIPIKFEPIIGLNWLEMFNWQHKEWLKFSYKVQNAENGNQAAKYQPTHRYRFPDPKLYRNEKL